LPTKHEHQITTIIVLVGNYLVHPCHRVMTNYISLLVGLCILWDKHLGLLFCQFSTAGANRHYYLLLILRTGVTWITTVPSVSYCTRYGAFLLPGQSAPWSESSNRTLANSFPGPFASRNFHSRERLFSGLVFKVSLKCLLVYFIL